MTFVDTIPVQSLPTSDSGWAGSSIRQRFEMGAVSQSGTAIKVKVKAGTSGATFSAIWAGHASVGAAFDGTQVQLTFGGSTALTLAANAEAWSDPVPYALSAFNPFIVAADCTSGGTLARRNPADSNCNFYYKSGTGAGTTSGSGFSLSSTTTLLVEQIQVDQAGSGSGGGNLVEFNLIGGTLPAAQSFTSTLYHDNITIDHSRRQARLGAAGGSVAIFGDSNTAGCSWTDVPFAENYGIAGDTLAGLIYRLRGGNYGSLANARAIVLANFPFNDICVASPNLANIEAMYASILSYFTGPLVIVPSTRTSTSSWNTNIATFNAWLASTYGTRSQCKIVDISDLQDGSGNAISGYTIDGQHWAAVQQGIIVSRVAAALRLV